MLREKQNSGRRERAGFRCAVHSRQSGIRANELVARLLHLIVADRCTSLARFLSFCYGFFFFGEIVRRPIKRNEDLDGNALAPRFFVALIAKYATIRSSSIMMARGENADADKGTN